MMTATGTVPVRQSSRQKAPPENRTVELETPESLELKVSQLLGLMRDSKKIVVYTGAGISTAANIPDYRGAEGVLTQARLGKRVLCTDIVQTEPTLTHLVIKELHRAKTISHVVSQNCDGLHLRSGLPQRALSEIHGNQHIEYCEACDWSYHIRPFDVVRKTSRRKKHRTERKCPTCDRLLRDSITYDGEKGIAPWPQNWSAVRHYAKHADLMIVVGSSLSVLDLYSFIWPSSEKNMQLVIINKEWTPRHKQATLAIAASCDDVFSLVAQRLTLDVLPYCRACDPVLMGRQSRRSRIMLDYGDCSCGGRDRALVPTDLNFHGYAATTPSPSGVPGWWRAGARKALGKAGEEEEEAVSSSSDDYTSYSEDESLTEDDEAKLPQGLKKKTRREKRRRPTTASEDEAKKAKKARKAAYGDAWISSSSEEEGQESEDEYAPFAYQKKRIAQPAARRATRSSGDADEQPLVGSFRKARRDIGVKRGPPPPGSRARGRPRKAATATRRRSSVVSGVDEERDAAEQPAGSSNLADSYDSPLTTYAAPETPEVAKERSVPAIELAAPQPSSVDETVIELATSVMLGTPEELVAAETLSEAKPSACTLEQARSPVADETSAVVVAANATSETSTVRRSFTPSETSSEESPTPSEAPSSCIEQTSEARISIPVV